MLVLEARFCAGMLVEVQRIALIVVKREQERSLIGLIALELSKSLCHEPAREGETRKLGNEVRAEENTTTCER